MKKLCIKGYGTKDVIFPINRLGAYVLGRCKNADIKISDDVISRRHALIIYSTKGLIIRDINSKNGIFVNGIKVNNAKLLIGDTVSMKSKFTIEVCSSS